MMTTPHAIAILFFVTVAGIAVAVICREFGE